ncbi:hypothetical protein AB6D11_00800 [Vibrio splendidus]
MNRPITLVELKSINVCSTSCDADPGSREYKLWKWGDDICDFICFCIFAGILFCLLRFEADNTNSYEIAAPPSISLFKECDYWHLYGRKLYASNRSQSFEEHGANELMEFQQSCDDHFYPTITLDSPLKNVVEFKVRRGLCENQDCLIVDVPDYDKLRSSLNLVDFNASVYDLFERIETQYVVENGRMSNEFVNKKDTELMQLTVDAKTMRTWK